MKTLDERMDEAPCGASVGPGWRPLLEELHRTLLLDVPDYTISQVKEKFGGLRFYVGLPEGTDDTAVAVAYAAIGLAERLSYRICETCGAPGELRGGTQGDWMRTACVPCDEEYKARRRERGWRQ